MKALCKHKTIRISPALTMIFLCAVVFGCENDADTLADQVQQLGFEILVLDEDQQSGTVFEPGTDIHVAQ